MNEITEQVQNQKNEDTLLNRRERRKKARYFEKLLKAHMKRKPTIKSDLPEDSTLNSDRTFQWVVRRDILLNKIKALQ